MLSTRLQAATLSRVRACIAAGIPGTPDLLADVEQCLAEVVAASSRRAERNRLIRQAALYLPPASPYTHAGLLAEETRAINRVTHITRRTARAKNPTTARACLQAAACMAELPSSQRQYWRVLRNDSR